MCRRTGLRENSLVEQSVEVAWTHGMEDWLKRIVRSNVRGVQLSRRPRMRWVDGVKRALNESGLSVEQGRMIVRNRSEWRAVVNA